MVGFAFIVEGMSVTPRSVLWSGIDLEMEVPSWSGAVLDRRVRARAIPLRNVRELAGALVEEWGNISQQKRANLVQSMRTVHED